MKPKKIDKIKEKENVYNTVSELYNKRFENYYDENNKWSNVKKNRCDQKFNPKNVKFEDYDHDGWFKKGGLDDVGDEGDEEM